MRIAVVSDIHGNDIALDAVLTHAGSLGFDRLFDLGDTVSGPLRPLETFERMASLDALAIAGNHERQLLSLAVEDMNASDAFTHARLGAVRVNTLRRRKPSARVEDIVLVHGSPSSDLEYLMEDDDGGSPRARRPEDVAAMVAPFSDGASLILCGHSHIQRAMQLDAGPLVVNPGSVGLPAFGNPGFGKPHRMEAGSRHARYAMIERRGHAWSVAFHLVEYDWRSAAADALALRRGDWAHALSTGFVAAA